MSNQLSKTDGKKSLKALLSSENMQEQFSKALPRHLTVERFTRVAITALTRTPKLQECTPESFMKCLLDLSAMGLEPDGRRAHLIPYGKECTLVLDYKGLVELARRSGDVATIHADVICENDAFEHNMGKIKQHTFELDQPRGEMIGAYAQVTLKDGSIQAVVLTRDEVDAVKNRSKAGKSGPWVTDYNEMAKKTAFRRLSKWLTLSPEVHNAVTAAEETEFGGMRNVTPPETNPFLPEPKKEEPPTEDNEISEEEAWGGKEEGNDE
jgi:recombination protein RecT